VWVWFAAWAFAGAVLALGFVSFALWLVLVPAGLVLVVALARFHRARASAFGFVSGLGISLLVVAYIQRDGPGTTCWRTATGGGCDQHLDPRPWLGAGLLFLLGGLIAQVTSFGPHRVSRHAPN
jgi:hypothetical protein